MHSTGDAYNHLSIPRSDFTCLGKLAHARFRFAFKPVGIRYREQLISFDSLGWFVVSWPPVRPYIAHRTETYEQACVCVFDAPAGGSLDSLMQRASTPMGMAVEGSDVRKRRILGWLPSCNVMGGQGSVE